MLGGESTSAPLFTEIRHAGHSPLPAVQPAPSGAPMRRAASIRYVPCATTPLMPDGSNVIETLISTSQPGLTVLVSVKPGETSANYETAVRSLSLCCCARRQSA